MAAVFPVLFLFVMLLGLFALGDGKCRGGLRFDDWQRDTPAKCRQGHQKNQFSHKSGLYYGSRLRRMANGYLFIPRKRPRGPTVKSKRLPSFLAMISNVTSFFSPKHLS